MSLKLEFGLLADTASLDSAGKLSLLGEFNTIWARKFPAIHGGLAVVAKLTQATEDLDAVEDELSVEFSTPTQQSLLGKAVKAKVKWQPMGLLGPGMSECRMLFNIAGLQLPEPGVYRIRISISGEQVSIPFLVVQREQPGSAGE